MKVHHFGLLWAKLVCFCHLHTDFADSAWPALFDLAELEVETLGASTSRADIEVGRSPLEGDFKGLQSQAFSLRNIPVNRTAAEGTFGSIGSAGSFGVLSFDRISLTAAEGMAASAAEPAQASTVVGLAEYTGNLSAQAASLKTKTWWELRGCLLVASGAV